MFEAPQAIFALYKEYMGRPKTESHTPKEMPTFTEFLWKMGICVVGAFLAQIILGGLYNISNHGLVDFPGPRWAAFTEWHRVYLELWKGKSWVHVLEEWHQKYGKIVRVSPNELSFSDPEAYNEIYNDKNRWNKEPTLYQSFGQDHSSFGFLKYEDAKKRKDIISPLFSHNSILDLQRLVQTNVDRLCEVLTNNNVAGKSSDLYLGIRCFAVDTITSFCFAKSVDALGEPDFKAPIVEAMEASLPAMIFFKHFGLIRKILFSLPPWLTVKLNPQTEGLVQLQKMLGAQIKKVRENPEALEDAPHPIIYHELLSTELGKGEKVPSASSLYEEAQSLTFKGVDTASNTIMLGTWHLLERPTLVHRLKKELLTAWPVLEKAPRYEALEKLPFLTAVVKESLRISPSGVAGVLPREAPSGKGATINGTVIPGETIVGMSALFVHNSETIFKDAKTFNPDRWLDPDSASVDKWLVSFSKGPRSCLGINLAYCELYLTFAALFRRFDLELDSISGKLEDIKWRDCFLPYFQGPHLKVFCKPVAK